MKFFTSTTGMAATLAVLFSLLVLVLHTLTTRYESQTMQEMLTLRYQIDKKYGIHRPDPRIVLAAIDETSTQQIGSWPFPRQVHGQFLQVLAPEKPKVVGWDIFFTEAKGAPATPDAAPDAQGQADDQALIDGAALLPHMVIAASRSEDFQTAFTESDILPTKPLKNVEGDTSLLLSSKYALLPFPALRKETYFGAADEPGDPGDGVRRQMPLMVNIDGLVLPSFDLQIMMQYWDIDADHVKVRLGHEVTLIRADGTQLSIPIDEHGRMLLNYRARLEDFTAMGYAWMGKGLADKSQNQTSPERSHLPPLSNGIVIVGVTFHGTDEGPTLLDAISPGVVTHLNALNNILEGDFLRPVSIAVWLPLYALFLFVVGSMMLRVGIAPLIPIGVFAVLFLAGFVFTALCYGNDLMPVFTPELGLLLLSGAIPTRRFFGEEREKTRVKNAMRAYLSDKVMISVLAHPDNLKLGGIKQPITVMFCDIRGFTQYCDERDPAEAVETLNDYMEEMTQVVFKYDGTIDKYIGDCIMAFWNAPEPQADHAQRAVCCAIEMRYALANFKTKRAGIDRELFECGIGIHTGEALVGNMGSSLKRNYTAMGSTVNMAARLEALTKKMNERILISADVVSQLQGEFPLTDRGEALVQGFAKPIHVYAVAADQDISSALNVGRTLAGQQAYTAEEANEPIWQPAALPQEEEIPAEDFVEEPMPEVQSEVTESDPLPEEEEPQV